MKTYEEIMDEVVTEEYKRINPVAMNIHKNAAKKYAKQWVSEALKNEPDSFIEYYLKQIDEQ